MAQLIEKDGDLVLRVEWTAEDIHQAAAEQLDLFLTPKQAREVLSLLAATHDCNYGINWDTIAAAIEANFGQWWNDPEEISIEYIRDYGRFAGYELDDSDIDEIDKILARNGGYNVPAAVNEYLATYEA